MTPEQFQAFYPQWQEFSRVTSIPGSTRHSGSGLQDGGRSLADRQARIPKRVLALGATSAIAQAALRLLAEQHASVFSGGPQPGKVGCCAQRPADPRSDRGDAFSADLDDTAAHPALLAKAVADLGGVDIALLAHGVLGDQSQAERDYAAAEAILHTNFLSAVSLMTWLANYFEAERRGTLAVISSVAGDRGRKSNYVYGASKGGLNIFLDGVRNRIDRAGVQVLTIKPGFVATPMTAHLPKNALFAQPAEVGKYIVRAIEKRKDVVYAPPFWASDHADGAQHSAAHFQEDEYVAAAGVFAGKSASGAGRIDIYGIAEEAIAAVFFARSDRLHKRKALFSLQIPSKQAKDGYCCQRDLCPLTVEVDGSPAFRLFMAGSWPQPKAAHRRRR